MLARRCLNANVSCCELNMLFCVEMWPNVSLDFHYLLTF